MKSRSFVVLVVVSVLAGASFRMLSNRFAYSRADANDPDASVRTIPSVSAEAGAGFWVAAAEGEPAAALNDLVGLQSGDDLQERLAAEDLALEKFSSWLAKDVKGAVGWLANQRRLPMHLRRRMIGAAAASAPDELLRQSTNPATPSVRLEFLQAGLASASAGTYDAEKILQDQLEAAGGRGSDVVGIFSEALGQRPGDLLALMPAVSNTEHRRLILEAGLAGLARDGLGPALDYIDTNLKGQISTETLARLLYNSKPADLDRVAGLLGNHPDRARLAARMASATRTWPEEERAKLLSWSSDQDPATKHAVATALIPKMDEMSESTAQMLMDGLVFDQAAQKCAVMCLSSKGDLSGWIEWVQTRGGLTEGIAKAAEERLGSLRASELAAWQLANPGISIADALRRPAER